MIFTSNYKEKDLHKEDKLVILGIFPAAFLIFGLVYSFLEGSSPIDGLLQIVQSPTTLLTDFLEVGGVGAAFINAGLVGFFNLLILRRYKMRINGLLTAALLTVLGFSFFGKNIINILPIYFGGYLYAERQKISMKNIILAIMFSTALAPLVSEITFGGLFRNGFNYVMGIASGTLIGFIIVPLSSQMIRFHDGFNLYNIGFTAGVVGTVFASLLKSFGVQIGSANILYTKNNLAIVILMFVLFFYLIAIGWYTNRNVFKEYPNIFKYKGRTVTDFTSLTGYGMTFFNMGVMGISSMVLVLVLGGVINGPVIAGILTIVGFSAFGKHPKNCFPIMGGVMLAGFFIGQDFSSTTFLISVLFSTTIAPLAGTYGTVVGVLAGMLHLTIVNNIGIIHGGINLYNNGFSGGLVAGFLVPIIDAFRKGEH